jgi:hypothetical protein
MMALQASCIKDYVLFDKLSSSRKATTIQK